MKQYYVSDLKKDDDIIDFFMVKSLQLKTGSNGKQYFDVILGDKTGEINGKKWDIQSGDEVCINNMKEKDILKVHCQITEYLDKPQMRILKMRIANEGDECDIKDFVKAAPEKSEDMYKYIFEVAESLEDKDLRAIALRVLTDNEERLMYYPAASKNHHAEYGGLLYHMLRMLKHGQGVCDVYKNLRRDWVLCGVIMHDIEKLNEIESESDGIATGYSVEGQLLGHIIMGVKTVDKLAMELGFSDEKRIMLEHMILAHHYEPDFGSPKRPLFPEAEVLHYLDVMDAKLFDMEDALEFVEPGGFSDKIWTLDNRKLYKSKEF